MEAPRVDDSGEIQSSPPRDEKYIQFLVPSRIRVTFFSGSRKGTPFFKSVHLAKNTSSGMTISTTCNIHLIYPPRVHFQPLSSLIIGDANLSRWNRRSKMYSYLLGGIQYSHFLEIVMAVDNISGYLLYTPKNGFLTLKIPFRYGS